MVGGHILAAVSMPPRISGVCVFRVLNFGMCSIPNMRRPSRAADIPWATVLVILL